MDEEAKRRFDDMRRFQIESLRARGRAMPYVLGPALLVLAAALFAKAFFNLEGKQAALILVLGWYILLPILFFVWTAVTAVRKATDDQARMAPKDKLPRDRSQGDL